jgi:hypothetical protein
MYAAGLPLDASVRYYPKADAGRISARVQELATGEQHRETWIGVALPKGISRADVGTTLIEGIHSLGELLGKRTIVESWPTGSWVKTYHETARQMDCATVSISSDPGRDHREAEVNFWSNYYDLRTAMANPPTWRLFASSQDSLSWRLPDGGYPRLEHGRVLRRVFGPAGRYRRAMACIANSECAPLVVFEIKMLLGESFFIDYEVGRPSAPTVRQNVCYNYDWFSQMD